MARGMISAIAAACAATSARSTNMATSPLTFRRRASSLTNPRAAAASMKTVLTSASVAAALPRASRFSVTTCRQAAPMCARFAIDEWRLRRRFRNRLINRETLCGMRASRAIWISSKTHTVPVAYHVVFQPPCFEAPFTSASMCFDTMKSFCRCTSKGLS